MNYFFNNSIRQIDTKIPNSLIIARWLLIILFVAAIIPKAYSKKFAAKPVVIMDGSNNFIRNCMYDDKVYSLGSIILVGKIYLECVAEKKIETNGRLMWRRVENKSPS